MCMTLRFGGFSLIQTNTCDVIPVDAQRCSGLTLNIWLAKCCFTRLTWVYSLGLTVLLLWLHWKLLLVGKWTFCSGDCCWLECYQGSRSTFRSARKPKICTQWCGRNVHSIGFWWLKSFGFIWKGSRRKMCFPKWHSVYSWVKYDTERWWPFIRNSLPSCWRGWMKRLKRNGPFCFHDQTAMDSIIGCGDAEPAPAACAFQQTDKLRVVFLNFMVPLWMILWLVRIWLESFCCCCYLWHWKDFQQFYVASKHRCFLRLLWARRCYTSPLPPIMTSYSRS